MKFETDPLALLAALVGVAAGVGVYIFLFRMRLEDGLRRRRSPGQVRLEAAGAGLAIGAAIPCVATWGLVVFVPLFVIALVLLALGRGWGPQTLIALGVALAVGLGASALQGRRPPSPATAAASAATTALAPPPAPTPAPATTGSKVDLNNPVIKPIGPDADTDPPPLVDPASHK